MLPPAILLDLTRRYCEPHRVFHSLRHVANMLMLGRDLDLTDEQVLAVWYHDAVYEVGSATNEADSAALAVAQLSAAGWPADSIATVERIVLDTVLHEPSIEASKPVLDLDLATLGGEWSEFSANSDRIRSEFAQMDDATWEAQQTRLFRRLLDRERIYCTPWGARREESARLNLRRATGGA